MGYAYTPDDFELLLTNEPFGKKILVEGDSWVSHPLLSNLSKQFERLSEDEVHVLNLAKPGDTANNILDPHGSQMKQLERLLSDPRWGYEFDYIFLSAAGNDIIGPDLLYHIKDKAQADDAHGKELITEAYAIVIDSIVEGYKKVVEIRDQSALNADTPIVTHSYAYMRPRPLGTHLFGRMFMKGWVSIYLKENKHITDEDEQEEIIRAMLDIFFTRISALQAKNFLAVDLRKELVDGNGKPDTGLFFDEIHPNGKGFRKLGQVIKEQCCGRQVWPFA